MAVITSLESYWSLDEASGDALDAHGSNTLTDGNTVGSAAGKVGNARDFEVDNSESFSHADNASLSIGNIDASWSAWVKLESKDSYRTIFAKWADPTYEYALRYDVSADRFMFLINGSAAGTANALGSPSLATWYHIVCWHDASIDTAAIIVNDGTPDTASVSSSGIADGTAAFTIGQHGGGVLYFDGLIDEVGFWKKKLSTTEITWLYNSGNGRSYADIVAESATTTVPVFMNQYRQRWR